MTWNVRGCAVRTAVVRKSCGRPKGYSLICLRRWLRLNVYRRSRILPTSFRVCRKFVGLPRIRTRSCVVKRLRLLLCESMRPDHLLAAATAEIGIGRVHVPAFFALDHKTTTFTILKSDTFPRIDRFVNRFDQLDRLEAIVGSYGNSFAVDDSVKKRSIFLNVAPLLFFFKHVE